MPACLLLDVRSTDLNGLDLQLQLDGAKTNIPIVFLTGHGDIAMSVRAIKAGAIEFLTKPCRAQDAGVVLHSLQAVIDCGFRRLNLAAKFLGTMFYEHFLV